MRGRQEAQSILAHTSHLGDLGQRHRCMINALDSFSMFFIFPVRNIWTMDHCSQSFFLPHEVPCLILVPASRMSTACGILPSYLGLCRCNVPNRWIMDHAEADASGFSSEPDSDRVASMFHRLRSDSDRRGSSRRVGFARWTHVRRSFGLRDG